MSDMSLDYPTMIRLFSQIIWPMGRIGGLVLTVPFFSSVLIPKRVKVFFVCILSWACADFVPAELSFYSLMACMLYTSFRKFFWAS